MQAERLTPTAVNIQRAAQALNDGKVVAMPTETVYGLAGVAFNEAALAAIFAAKERPKFDPLICHVPIAHSADWLAHLQRLGLVEVSCLGQLAQQRLARLAATFWPGPLTLVLPKQSAVPDLATSGLPSVGVRCPRHPVAQQLLVAVGAPLAAPSANRFGRISPTTAEHVAAELGDRIELILDGGPCEIGIESSVVLLEPSGELALLRPGQITRSQLEATIGAPLIAARPEASGGTPLPSPGLLASHYAPRKPLQIVSIKELQKLSIDVLSHSGVLIAENTAELPHRPASYVELSPAGDLTRAAQRLFASLRALDDDPYVDAIFATLCTDESGLGFAINDRLRRASHT